MSNNNKEYKPKRVERKPVSDEVHTGVFSRKENYGFIEGQDLFVRWENMNTALNKDVVEYIILENEESTEEKRFEAKILRVLERYKVCFTGDLIYKEKENSYVLLDNPRLNKVVSTPLTEFSIGEKVMVKLTNFNPEKLEGEIVKGLGNKNDPGVDVKAILEEFRIDLEFSKEVQEEVETIQLDIEKHKTTKPRKDCTHIPLITIDPEDSKDFDDAIGVFRDEEEDEYTLYVAIADVWTYIKDHKKVTEEAQNRTTSIYYLNSVIPMLPEKLSNDFCSLMPNQERCALMVEIRLDTDGKAIWKNTKIYPAIIKSRRRFTYKEVNNFFSGEDKFFSESWEIKELLRRGYSLYRMLEDQRIKRGFVQLENCETKMILGDKGEVHAFHNYVRGHAQFMIENFMILANESVAKYLTEKEIPGIFRIHTRPEPNKLAAFISEVKKLNFVIRTVDDNISQKTIYKWFQDNKNHPLLEIIGTWLLRSLPKAIYSITNDGHFGLNLSHYLHFTSPIRRYPDVMVHRMLWEYVFEKKDKPQPGDKIYQELDEIAKHCTDKEIEATEVTRSIESAKMIQYLNTQLEKIFKARVISTVKYGGFVRLDGINVEGFVKSREPLKLGDYVLVKPNYNNRELKLIKVL